MERDLKLIDFKIEFGIYDDEIILADEISPIHAGCGRYILMKKWIKTDSEEISATLKRPIKLYLNE